MNGAPVKEHREYTADKRHAKLFMVMTFVGRGADK
jgi:hypothetical protein